MPERYFRYMQNEVINASLVRKYNQPVPGFTNYPMLPFWKEHLSVEEWTSVFKDRFAEQNPVNGISLYIHLPFSRDNEMTTNHRVETAYLDALVKEWGLYRKIMNLTPIIREIHLGEVYRPIFHPAM
jgi:oxygen-independent coproporphyrinogen-3 oxidase